MCCRNNEDTIEKTFYLLDQIETENKMYNFRYYIYENDSTDNTKKKIIDFFRNHKGNCLFETLKNKQWGSVKDEKRVIEMSIYRNKMKKLCTNFKKSYYSIILDTNITFQPSIFNDMLNIFSQEPNIHMITPFGFVEGKPKVYYDTFALDLVSDLKGSNFKKLLFEIRRNKLVKLKSGFAGFVMIKTQTLQKCSWNSSSVCSEHNQFCDEVKKYGDIVCAADIKVSWKQ